MNTFVNCFWVDSSNLMKRCEMCKEVSEEIPVDDDRGFLIEELYGEGVHVSVPSGATAPVQECVPHGH